MLFVLKSASHRQLGIKRKICTWNLLQFDACTVPLSRGLRCVKLPVFSNFDENVYVWCPARTRNVLFGSTVVHEYMVSRLVSLQYNSSSSIHHIIASATQVPKTGRVFEKQGIASGLTYSRCCHGMYVCCSKNVPENLCMILALLCTWPKLRLILIVEWFVRKSETTLYLILAVRRTESVDFYLFCLWVRVVLKLTVTLQDYVVGF